MGIEILIAAGIAAAVSAGQYAISYALSGGGDKPKPLDNARAVDPRISGSRYGAFITRTYGTVEIGGQIIWATDIRDTVTTIPGQRSKRGSTPDQVNHRYSRSFAVMFCTGEVAGVTRLTFDDKTYYESPTLGAVLTDKLQIHIGSESQTPNTWYEADKGVGNVSAHRGYCVVYFYDVDLGPYGDRIPNVRAEIVKAEDQTLASVVADECALGGLSPAQYSTTQLTEETLDGYFVNQLAPVRSSLEQLGKAFQFDGPEYDGRINFRSRPLTSVALVPWADLGTVEEDDGEDEDEPTPLLSTKRRQSAEIARTVSVVYFDKERNYEEGNQSYSRQNFTSQTVEAVSFNVVMSPERANRLAKIIAVTGWTERLPVDLSLPPEYLVYAPGDVLTVPREEDGETIEVRIEQMDFAAPGVVRISGVEQFAESYDQTGDGGGEGEAVPVPPPVEDPCPTEIWIDDRPSWRYRDQGNPGHFIAGSPNDCPLAGAVWRGTSVLRDVDGAGDYKAHALINEAATMGRTLTVLADGSGLDTVHTVDVHLSSGIAASITDDSFNADETLNLWAIGGETCQVRDVLDLGGDDYRFSHIRRGMFHTESATAGHATDEQVVLLDARIQRVEHNLEDIGKTFEIVPVTYGSTIDDSLPQAVTFEYGARGVEPGGDAPSAPQSPVVTGSNGTPTLIWDEPAENNQTIYKYVVSVFEDVAMTIPVAGYEDIEVTSNQFTLPHEEGEPERFYAVKAVNLLGEGAEVTGSYTPLATIAGAHAASHASGGSDPLTGDLDATARVAVRKNSAGASTGARRRLNLIEGAGVGITIADDAVNEELDIQIAVVPRAVTSVSTNTTLTSAHRIVLVNTTAGAVTLTLPAATGVYEFTIKNTGTGSNRVIIDGNASETIDGNATVELADGDRLTVIADTANTNWQSV